MVDLRLEPFARHHLAEVDRMVSDPLVQRYTRVPVPDGWTTTWLEAYERGRLDGTREAWAVVDGEGRVLGCALAPAIDREARTAELGYIVAPWARGRGVATEAVRQLTRWAFDDLGLLRLQLLISVGNEASKRVAAKAGYRFEGVLRSMHFRADERDDMESWSRLPRD